MGDSNEELVADVMMEGSQRPIEGYIAAVAAGGKDSATLTSSSVLYMLSHHTGFYDIMQQDSEQVKPYQKVKLTHLTLVDGDNNQIHARMATHLADAGRALEERDIIQLKLFSELTYHGNDNSPPMPALFITGYTRVGQGSGCCATRSPRNDLLCSIRFNTSVSINTPVKGAKQITISNSRSFDPAAAIVYIRESIMQEVWSQLYWPLYLR